MFIFASRRTGLLKRLWRQQPRDEAVAEQRAVATALLKRLKEPQLEGLVQAAEGSGREAGPCCRVPCGNLRLGRRGAVSPQVLTARLLRWPEVREEAELVLSGLCPLGGEEGEGGSVCCNPWHWARRLDSDRPPAAPVAPRSPSPPPPSSHSGPPPYSLLPPSQVGVSPLEGGSVATGGDPGPSTQGRVSWCTLAYWEERRRVGPQFPVHRAAVSVQAAPPRGPPPGDALSLAGLAAANPRPSEATLRTREKIGLGVILSRDDAGVWAYNRTDVPVFVNSPTLDTPNSRSFSVFKIPPGYSLQIFSWAVARQQAGVRDPALQDGPFDPHAVRLSFAKGWGGRYSRQSVDCCPCWLEVLLRPPHR